MVECQTPPAGDNGLELECRDRTRVFLTKAGHVSTKKDQNVYLNANCVKKGKETSLWPCGFATYVTIPFCCGTWNCQYF